MNTKPILFLSCFVAMTLAASVVTAAARGGNHSMGMSPRGGRPVVSNGMRVMGNWNGQHWHGGNWSCNWRHDHADFDRHDHRHHFHDNDDFNNVIFFGGFPFWDWGWGWGYPYGYYGYYPYGYYGNGYYGGSGYGGFAIAGVLKNREEEGPPCPARYLFSCPERTILVPRQRGKLRLPAGPGRAGAGVMDVRLV